MSLHTRLVFKLLALATCAAAASSAAQAADNTRYVSITGDNANACTLAAPCRTLQRGINVTPVGGELRILDFGVSANNATVSKSMTISGNGNTIFLGTAIAIDAAAAVVTLRGLTLNGQGTVDNGISIVAAALVHIEHCVIHNFADIGIVAPASAAGVRLFVSDSTSRDNGEDGLNIVNAGASRLTVDNSRFDSNGDSGLVVSSGYATISRSTASGNGRNGIEGHQASVSVVSTMAVKNGFAGFYVHNAATMTVGSSLAHGNDFDGLAVFNGAIARISSSTFTQNRHGIRNFSTVETLGDNTVRGNTLIDLSGNALSPIGGI